VASLLRQVAEPARHVAAVQVWASAQGLLWEGQHDQLHAVEHIAVAPIVQHEAHTIGAERLTLNDTPGWALTILIVEHIHRIGHDIA